MSARGRFIRVAVWGIGVLAIIAAGGAQCLPISIGLPGGGGDDLPDGGGDDPPGGGGGDLPDGAGGDPADGGGGGPPDGDGVGAFDSVLIELVNVTDYEVDPYLYVGPDESAPESLIIAPANEVIVDPLVQPGEVVTLEFACTDAGALASDHAQLVAELEVLAESDNAPLLRQGEHFVCGDIVSLIFIDDGVVFYTRVEVNDTFLMD